VYFWRWAIWKAFEQTESGPAVVGFITASSWISGPGFLGLRQLARELADEILVVDLGGDNLGARIDENVFPIQNAVAIVMLVRSGAGDPKSPALVKYFRATGSRAEKLNCLDQFDFGGGQWLEGPRQWQAPLAPPSGGDDWQAFPALVDLFPWQQPGCMWSRTWPVSPDRATLRARWRRFVATEDLSDRTACYVTPASGRSIHTRVAGYPVLASLPVGAHSEPIVRFGYRAFDRQWAFDDPRLAKTESPALWESVGDRQVFMVTLMTSPLGSGPGAVASAAVPDKHYFRGSYGGKDVIPLYRDSEGNPNIDQRLLKELSDVYGRGNENVVPVTPESLMSYVYGVLAGADYTERFVQELATAGPRVPMTADLDVFAAMASHGARLLWLHTYGERFRGNGRGDFRVPKEIKWKKEPTRVPSGGSDVTFDPVVGRLVVADGVLEGVTADAWEFSVSGMHVMRKWLGYRSLIGTGRAASSPSPLDRIRPKKWSSEWSDELRELVYVLTETVKLQRTGKDLLDALLHGELIDSDSLPIPPEALRKPPASKSRSATLL
jgi:hypothetical protein